MPVPASGLFALIAMALGLAAAAGRAAFVKKQSAGCSLLANDARDDLNRASRAFVSLRNYLRLFIRCRLDQGRLDTLRDGLRLRVFLEETLVGLDDSAEPVARRTTAPPRSPQALA